MFSFEIQNNRKFELNLSEKTQSTPHGSIYMVIGIRQSYQTLKDNPIKGNTLCTLKIYDETKSKNLIIKDVISSMNEI